jgi:hypothetical protein
MALTVKEWYKVHGVNHAHCPNGCEHPQPFIINDELMCGRCAHKDGIFVPMVPCRPEVCQ